MIEIAEVFADPFDYLENAVFAHKLVCHYQAVVLEQLASYAAVTERDPFAHLELAARLHTSDRAAQQRLQFAVELTTRLPQMLAELKQGHLEEFKVRLTCDATRLLTDEHAAR